MHQGKPAGEGGMFAECLVMEKIETATFNHQIQVTGHWIPWIPWSYESYVSNGKNYHFLNARPWPQILLLHAEHLSGSPTRSLLGSSPGNQ